MNVSTITTARRAPARRLRLARPLMLATLMVPAGCAVSTQQELEMGAQYAAQLERELEFVEDRAVNSYVSGLGQRIARHGERGIPYRFRVVNSKVVNAFAVPGGYVYVNRGLIERASSEAELAGVLAHEIAHVEQRHTAEQLERVQGANLGLTLAYVLMGRAPSTLERGAINVGGGLVLARHSRDAEEEADAVAVPLLVSAGIDPHGLVTFFEKLIQDRRRSPSALEMWFSTHPTTEDRVQDVQRHIARVPSSQLRGLTRDSQPFRSVKSRLSGMPQPRG